MIMGGIAAILPHSFKCLQNMGHVCDTLTSNGTPIVLRFCSDCCIVNRAAIMFLFERQVSNSATLQAQLTRIYSATIAEKSQSDWGAIRQHFAVFLKSQGGITVIPPAIMCGCSLRAGKSLEQLR